jgi:hypothetical protein
MARTKQTARKVRIICSIFDVLIAAILEIATVAVV